MIKSASSMTFSVSSCTLTADPQILVSKKTGQAWATKLCAAWFGGAMDFLLYDDDGPFSNGFPTVGKEINIHGCIKMRNDAPTLRVLSWEYVK